MPVTPPRPGPVADSRAIASTIERFGDDARAWTGDDTVSMCAGKLWLCDPVRGVIFVPPADVMSPGAKGKLAHEVAHALFSGPFDPAIAENKALWVMVQLVEDVRVNTLMERRDPALGKAIRDVNAADVARVFSRIESGADQPARPRMFMLGVLARWLEIPLPAPIANDARVMRALDEAAPVIARAVKVRFDPRDYDDDEALAAAREAERIACVDLVPIFAALI